jgi:hypothetical protein
MSTQRRERRSTPPTVICRSFRQVKTTCRGRWGQWRPVRCMECAEVLGQVISPSFPQRSHAHANGRTASSHPSDKNLLPGLPARLAANSLQSDRRTRQLVRLVLFIRSGSPPPPGGRRVSVFRSSFPPIPLPPGLARLHRTLPQVHAALSCRTERYDGKRNLYFQHAA